MGRFFTRNIGAARGILVLAILLAMLLWPTAGFAGRTRTDTQGYVAGGDVLIVECGDETTTGKSIGGVCFSLSGNETTAFVDINDVTELPVGGIYDFRDASDASLGLDFFCDSTAVNVPAGSKQLLIFLSTGLGPLSCLPDGSPGIATTGEVAARYELGGGGGGKGGRPTIDTERECLEPVPDSLSISGVTDAGQRVSLDVRVLLDGISLARGTQVMTKAAESYAPFGIDLTATYKSVSFSGDDAQGLINQAKNLYRGERPRGIDVVYVLTNEDIQAAGQTGVAGLADCIGGVRFAERAFAVGEDVSFENLDFGPVVFYLNATAKIASHEIGHLMGAHHHYANCAEGVTTETTEGEPSPCTLMINFLDFASINFSAVNGPIVRGHALNYASP